MMDRADHPLQSWQILATRPLLDHSSFLRVEAHTLQLPDGQIIDDWPWIITPDYVIVMAETENGRFLCFRQYKYGVGGVTLAPVGGYLEPDEAPLAAAQRELLEETGYRAEEWHTLGQFVVDGNRGAGNAHLFLARRAHRVADPDADDLETQQLRFLTPAELDAALAAGRFKALAWATAVAMTLHRV